MDYQGNYFPDEVDERESKTYRIVKKTLKIILYGCSALVWVLLFYFLFINRDRDVLENNYFKELPAYDAQSGEIELIRVNPREFMNYDGSFQVFNVDYAESLHALEIGVKYNKNHFKVKSADGAERDLDPLFTLVDNNGREYELAYVKTDSGGRYAFFRLCFTGMTFDLESNDVNVDKVLREQAQAETETREEYLSLFNYLKKNHVPASNDSYTLYLRDASSPQSEPEATILIYDNGSVIYSVDYIEG